MSSWKRNVSTVFSLPAFYLKNIKIDFGAVIGVASAVVVRIRRAVRVREIAHTTKHHRVKKANTRKCRRRDRIVRTVGLIENKIFFSFYIRRSRSEIFQSQAVIERPRDSFANASDDWALSRALLCWLPPEWSFLGLKHTSSPDQLSILIKVA